MESRAHTFGERFAQIPVQLVTKVNGDTTETGFLYIGSEILKGIHQALPSLDQARTVLDFGCGLGRVSHQLCSTMPALEVTGFDIDPQMLQWAPQLVGCERFKLVASTLGLPDAGFDTVLAVSVFTHLDETTAFWLNEIARLLSPGGSAFLTYQDDQLFRELASKGEIPGFSTGTAVPDKYVVGHNGPEGGAGMGTFYTPAEWERTLRPYFEVISNVPRGLFGHQSFTVVRPKADRRVNREQLLVSYAASVERDLFELRK